MSKPELTEKEKIVYDCIVKSIKKNGYGPSVRDVSRAIGIGSTAMVFTYITGLCNKGYITKDAGTSRSIRLTSNKTGKNTTHKIPLLGNVAAGAPILAEENITEYVDVAVDGYSNDELFALCVKGESMIDAGICDGDTIIVKRTELAENGEIVVAMVTDPEPEATVKRFYKENGRYRLQPENAAMPPIIVDTVTVLGKVVALVRYF